jgi:hypothetical protein
MRILIAIVFSVLLIGGVAAYIRFADSVTPIPIDVSQQPASGKFAIDVTLTFDVVKDPFSGFEPFGLQIKISEQVLLTANNIRAGAPIRVDDVSEIKVGKNEFWIYAAAARDDIKAEAPQPETAPDPFSGFEMSNKTSVDVPLTIESQLPQIDHAIRIRIFRDGTVEPVAEQTIWSKAGEAVQGTVTLHVDPDENSPNTAHVDDEHATAGGAP